MNKDLDPCNILYAVESLKETAYQAVTECLDELPSNLRSPQYLVHILEAVVAKALTETTTNYQKGVSNFSENVLEHINYLNCHDDKIKH